MISCCRLCVNCLRIALGVVCFWWIICMCNIRTSSVSSEGSVRFWVTTSCLDLNIVCESKLSSSPPSPARLRLFGEIVSIVSCSCHQNSSFMDLSSGNPLLRPPQTTYTSVLKPSRNLNVPSLTLSGRLLWFMKHNMNLTDLGADCVYWLKEILTGLIWLVQDWTR